MAISLILALTVVDRSAMIFSACFGLSRAGVRRIGKRQIVIAGGNNNEQVRRRDEIN